MILISFQSAMSTIATLITGAATAEENQRILMERHAGKTEDE